MEERGSRRSKVARLLKAYEITDFGVELERRWTADDSDRRWSLRDMESEFNQRLLRAAMREAGVRPLDGEVKNTYRLLTDEGVSTADRTRARRRLEQNGVDVDSLTDDFVSYQALRTYLRNYREVEHEFSANRRESAQQTVQQVQSRLTNVVTGRLERLRDGGCLTLGDFRVIVDVRVICENCGTRSIVGDLLTAGGCGCGEE